MTLALDEFWTPEYIHGLRALAHRPPPERRLAAVGAAALPLTVLSETSSTITVGWTPPAGAAGYEFTVDGKRVSNTWDPTVKETRFGKPDAGQHTYGVVAVGVLVMGSVQSPQPSPPPPPPPGTGPDGNARHLTSLGIDGSGVVEDDFYLQGGYCNIVGTNATVSRFDIGPSNDSNIIVEDGAAGAHIRDGRVHACGTPRAHTWGDHGIYGSAARLLVERVESFGQGSFGQAFSPRWYDSVYTACWAHDSYAAIGVFDYSDGANAGHWLPLLYGFFTHGKITGWSAYIDTPRNSHKSGYQGPNTIPLELYHATLDLRGQSTVPFNYSGDPVDGGSSFYNCCLIWDGPVGGWYHSPRRVNLTGTVILSSAQAAQYLEADMKTPKKVAGSPLLGKAAKTTGRGHSVYGNFGDVGAVQEAA